MTESTHDSSPAGGDSLGQDDPDADPANLNPRDDRDATPYEGDPDADPAMLNPRDMVDEPDLS